jgi:hypothetical protein
LRNSNLRMGTVASKSRFIYKRITNASKLADANSLGKIRVSKSATYLALSR